MTESTALTVFDRPLLPGVIFKEGGSQSFLDEIKAFAASIDKDISTEAGRDNIRSVAYKITRTKTTLDKMGEQLKDDAQKVVDAVNKERRLIRTELDALAEETRAPLTEWENKEKKRVLMHEAALKALELQSEWRDMPEPDGAGIRVRIEQVSKSSLDGWEEFTARATATKETVLRSLGLRLDAREKLEAEQAELARLRSEEAARQQKERDDRIAEEAAAAAKKAAEDKAAADAKALADKVAADAAKAAADLKAAQDREAAATAKAAKDLQDAKDRAARDAQKLIDDAAAAKKAEEDAAAARAADVEHKKKINNEAADALNHQLKISISDAQAIITAIAQGKVPHVRISY